MGSNSRLFVSKGRTIRRLIRGRRSKKNIRARGNDMKKKTYAPINPKRYLKNHAMKMLTKKNSKKSPQPTEKKSENREN